MWVEIWTLHFLLPTLLLSLNSILVEEITRKVPGKAFSKDSVQWRQHFKDLNCPNVMNSRPVVGVPTWQVWPLDSKESMWMWWQKDRKALILHSTDKTKHILWVLTWALGGTRAEGRRCASFIVLVKVWSGWSLSQFWFCKTVWRSPCCLRGQSSNRRLLLLGSALLLGGLLEKGCVLDSKVTADLGQWIEMSCSFGTGDVKADREVLQFLWHWRTLKWVVSQQFIDRHS